MNYLAERRQEEKERRRAEILDAAEGVAASVGWDELTMDQVARRARLSRALLYVYFKDKVLETGVRDGSIRADLGDPRVVSNALWGMTHGVVQLASTKAKLLAHHGVDGRAVIEQTLAMATRALAANP